MGWEALQYWGKDVRRLERLTGGVANDVWRVQVDGRLAVARLGMRSDADLAWEARLLQHLDRNGMLVPLPVPTMDGRLFVDGLVVMKYLEGEPPETEGDWRRVAGTLRELHRLTRGWPQRPGWRSSTDLLQADRGTRIDLTAMPPEGVMRCRAAWARLAGRPTCVIHGDANPRNIFMTADQGRVACRHSRSRSRIAPQRRRSRPRRLGHRASGFRRLGGCRLLERRLLNQAACRSKTRLIDFPLRSLLRKLPLEGALPFLANVAIHLLIYFGGLWRRHSSRFHRSRPAKHRRLPHKLLDNIHNYQRDILLWGASALREGVLARPTM